MTEKEENKRRHRQLKWLHFLFSVVGIITALLFVGLMPSIISEKVRSHRRERAADYRNGLLLGLNFISIPYDNQTHTVPMFSVKNLGKCLGY
jgi:hypothetical protein